MQWGTPDDVDEYKNWSNIFKNILLKKYENKSIVGKNESNIIAMAGLGKRFYDEGYKKIKPMIEVSGKPMVLQAVNDLPRSKSNTYVLRSDMKNYKKIIENISKADSSASFKILDGVTDGQASTALIGLYAAKNKPRWGNAHNLFFNILSIFDSYNKLHCKSISNNI